MVLDLISGGEMFDQLCSEGAYSEADAARLVREVANALAFMHGIGIVHGDLKRECGLFCWKFTRQLAACFLTPGPFSQLKI